MQEPVTLLLRTTVTIMDTVDTAARIAATWLTRPPPSAQLEDPTMSPAAVPTLTNAADGVAMRMKRLIIII